MLRGILVWSLLTGCASWKKRDLALEGLFIAAQTADMLQTVNITKTCSENNPVIGDCGEHVSPQIWFPVTTIVDFLLADQLEDYRGTILGLSVGVESTVVFRNYNDGVPFFAGSGPVPSTPTDKHMLAPRGFPRR